MNQQKVDKYREWLKERIRITGLNGAKETGIIVKFCLSEFESILAEPDIPNVTIEPDIHDMSDAD